MAMMVAMIPKGYSDEKKAEFMESCAICAADGLKLDYRYWHVHVHEFDPKDCCETFKNTMYIIAYSGIGKGIKNKGDYAAVFKRECDKVFGPDENRKVVAIVEEHDHDMIATNSRLRTEDPEFIAYLNSINVV